MKQDPVIAIVHYHLRRGGVTRVIQNATASLEGQALRCVVLTGEAPPDGIEIKAPVIVLEGLGYSESRERVDPDALLRCARDAVRKRMGRWPDCWHIHNHSLGKNPAWTQAVAQLSAEGDACWLQIHDFPEDGRPANYRRLRENLGGESAMNRTLYPLGPSTRYALLNRRDQDVLMRAGLPESRALRLPNPVWTGSDGRLPDPPDGLPPLILYPTRAIRRKNIGEFLLWSSVGQGAARYGITLAPENPTERAIYDRWVDFALEERLPVEFELGRKTDFGDLLASATALATTSIAEGFGLAFLEPWSAGRTLCGRNLPEITGEFEETGMEWNGLYDALTVPVEWVDVGVLRRAVKDALTQARLAYGHKTMPSDVEVALDAALQDGRVEFGHLNEEMQARIIRRIRQSPDEAAALSPLELSWVSDPDLVQGNRCVIEREYGLAAYGRRLSKMYASAMEPAEEAEFRADSVLKAFTDPSRFFLMRT